MHRRFRTHQEDTRRPKGPVGWIKERLGRAPPTPHAAPMGAGEVARAAHHVPAAFPTPSLPLSLPSRLAAHLATYTQDAALLDEAAPGVLRRVGRDVARDVAGNLGAGDRAEALLELAWHWQMERLGTLVVLDQDAENVAFEVRACRECRDAPAHPHTPAPRRCAFTAGFIEETLTRTTGTPWEATELECRSAEGSACRFLLERSA